MEKLMSILLVGTFTLVFSSFTRNEKINIWMIGDSTMATKDALHFPETGWGSALSQYTIGNAKIHNHAMNGRSSLSFINEGRWNVVCDSLKSGDYVIIQFGHNDEKSDSTRHTEPYSTFKQNIQKFIIDSRSKGAIPIVCSSIVRRHFDSEGNLIDTHGNYIIAAKEIAIEMNTPYIDLEASTRKLVTNLGPEKSKTVYNFCLPGEYNNYLLGKQDSTHLNVNGASIVAGLFVEEVKAQKIPLADFFK